MSDNNYLGELFADGLSPHPDLATSGIRANGVDRSKVVCKGWGEERWLVAETAPWGFKLIHIEAGRRTSLQYHRHKEEACIVLRGEGLLQHAASAGDELQTLHVQAGDVVHLAPGHVHRFEGITRLTMVEVSTPHLDDVVRISDDFGRGDGRVEAEHDTVTSR